MNEDIEVEATLDKDFLDIADLKEMNISKLTQIAKELDVPGATGMRKQELIFKILKSRGVKGEIPGRLTGMIQMYDNGKADTFTLSFRGADILSVTPDKLDATTEEIKLVKVELYVEHMSFTYHQAG